MIALLPLTDIGEVSSGADIDVLLGRAMTTAALIRPIEQDLFR